MIYFAIVTFTTTGYGDITPKTIPGMALSIVFFLALIAIIIPLISEV